jgi:hypothetical protein
MQVRFLSDGSEYRSYGGGSLSQKKEKGGIFWWAILITLLMGAATFCWFFSIMVFSHPEKPFNYKVLAKFNKLTPLRPYSIYTTPNGKTFGPRDIFGEFYAYSPDQLNVRNDLFKRSYLKNYQHEQPIYLLGNYRVLSTRPLNKEDVFTDGWIVRARATDLEDMDVELVMPGLASDAAPYAVGDTFNLQKRNYATALHIQRMEEDRICVTVLPLAYKASAKAGQEIKEITLEPPTQLNMEGYWPITRDPGSEFALSQQQENNDIAATKP